MMKLTILSGSGSKNRLEPDLFRKCRARRKEEKNRSGRLGGNANDRASLRGVRLRLGPYSRGSILSAYLMRNLFAVSGPEIVTACARTQRGAFAALGLLGEAIPDHAITLCICNLLALFVFGRLARSPWACGTRAYAGDVRPIKARIPPPSGLFPVRSDLAIRDCLIYQAERGGSITYVRTFLENQEGTRGNEKCAVLATAQEGQSDRRTTSSAPCTAIFMTPPVWGICCGAFREHSKKGSPHD